VCLKLKDSFVADTVCIHRQGGLIATESSNRDVILTKRLVQFASVVCLMIFLAACAVTKPPVSTATGAEPATAELEKCEATDKCDDTMMQRYQHYLDVLSNIWIL